MLLNLSPFFKKEALPFYKGFLLIVRFLYSLEKIEAMLALYKRTEYSDSHHFNGYVFREKKFILRQAESGWNRVYELQIMKIDHHASKVMNVREVKKSLESYIGSLFFEELYHFGFLRVKSSPKEHIWHKKVRKHSKFDETVEKIFEKYRAKGYKIPEKIPSQGHVAERKEPGSLIDLFIDPEPSIEY